jgi:hypothetical protein
MLGEVMSSAFAASEEFRQSLPLLMEACRNAGLREPALRMLAAADRAPSGTDFRAYLDIERARILTERGQCDRAIALVEGVRGKTSDPELQLAARLVEAEVEMARNASPYVLDLCCEVARRAESKELQRRALELMGRYYSATGEPDRALLAYSGKVPLTSPRRLP